MEFSGFSAARNMDYRNGILRGVQEADAAQKVFFALVEETKEESLRCKDGRKKRHRRGWYEIFRKCIECCIKGTTGGQKDMSENKVMNGQIQIADEVIGVIAVTAALEVEGVAYGSGSKSFVEFFGKKGQTKCVKVVKDENEAVLDMDIIVNFGTKVQVVAEEVQKKVKNAVETMTGLNVAVVNVSVSGIVREKSANAEEEE